MVLILKDKISEIILGYYFGDKKECPPLRRENAFLAKSAVDLADSIRSGEITSTQLVEATIDRMKEVNSILNAIVDGPFLEALEEARAIDERISGKQITEGFFSFSYRQTDDFKMTYKLNRCTYF